MAKQKKRREADFTTKEMADLSNCKSEQTFMNRLNSVCEHYGIDPMLFKMDETINSSENFFPAERGELLALLQRLCVDIDKANYNLFWNYKFISMAQQANEEETEKYEQFMDLIYGDRDDRKVELKKE